MCFVNKTSTGKITSHKFLKTFSKKKKKKKSKWIWKAAAVWCGVVQEWKTLSTCVQWGQPLPLPVLFFSYHQLHLRNVWDELSLPEKSIPEIPSWRSSSGNYEDLRDVRELEKSAVSSFMLKKREFLLF